ncbi:MAG TPA: response regulator transcription factor [Terriglobales bacterium]|nr:response regulator transcription factor [Terriglobales bacterium]
MKRIRVLLGDDHALILDGVRASLQDQFEIAGEAYDGKALVDAAEKLRPDVVILDISMPVLNGFESARLIKKSLPAVRIIFLSQHLNPQYLKHALKAGASGYVLKSGAREELHQAIEAALRGQTYITPSFGEDVRSQLLNRSGEIGADDDELTDRQREILQLIVQGKANKEIADMIHVSVKTVEFHRARIMARLGVRSVAELTKVALQQGLIAE